MITTTNRHRQPPTFGAPFSQLNRSLIPDDKLFLKTENNIDSIDDVSRDKEIKEQKESNDGKSEPTKNSIDTPHRYDEYGFVAKHRFSSSSSFASNREDATDYIDAQIKYTHNRSQWLKQFEIENRKSKFETFAIDGNATAGNTIPLSTSSSLSSLSTIPDIENLSYRFAHVVELERSHPIDRLLAADPIPGPDIRAFAWTRLSGAIRVKINCKFTYEQLCELSRDVTPLSATQIAAVMPYDNICFDAKRTTAEVAADNCIVIERLQRLLRCFTWWRKINFADEKEKDNREEEEEEEEGEENEEKDAKNEESDLRNKRNRNNRRCYAAMNYPIIAAHLLLICGEEDAFWLLAKLSNDIDVAVCVTIIDACVDRCAPLVARQLRRHQIDASCIVAHWLTSLFAGTIRRAVILFRVWDLCFAYGPVATLAIALGTLVIESWQFDASPCDHDEAYLFNMLSNLPSIAFDDDDYGEVDEDDDDDDDDAAERRIEAKMLRKITIAWRTGKNIVDNLSILPPEAASLFYADEYRIEHDDAKNRNNNNNSNNANNCKISLGGDETIFGVRFYRRQRHRRPAILSRSMSSSVYQRNGDCPPTDGEDVNAEHDKDQNSIRLRRALSTTSSSSSSSSLSSLSSYGKTSTPTIEQLRAKNITQTRLVMNLHAAIVAIADHFQSYDLDAQYCLKPDLEAEIKTAPMTTITENKSGKGQATFASSQPKRPTTLDGLNRINSKQNKSTINNNTQQSPPQQWSKSKLRNASPSYGACADGENRTRSLRHQHQHHNQYYRYYHSGARLARALLDFDATESDELAFHRNDIIAVIEQRDEHCWIGERAGTIGWFPAQFVEIITTGASNNCSIDDFNNFDNSISIAAYSIAGDDRIVPFANDLVRGRLCSALKALLVYDLRHSNSSGGTSGPFYLSMMPYAHPWLVLEQIASRLAGSADFAHIYSRLILTRTFALDDDRRMLSGAELLYRSIAAVNRAHTRPATPHDVKLRSLITYGLNHRCLHEWFELMCVAQPTIIAKHYGRNSFLTTPVWKLIKAELRLLTQFPFNLNPNAESEIDYDTDAYAVSDTRFYRHHEQRQRENRKQSKSKSNSITKILNKKRLNEMSQNDGEDCDKVGDKGEMMPHGADEEDDDTYDRQASSSQQPKSPVTKEGVWDMLIKYHLFSWDI